MTNLTRSPLKELCMSSAITPHPKITTLSPQELEELDKFLMSDATSNETMMIDRLDGYLTAIVIGPKVFEAGEWLPRIWGPTAENAPNFLKHEQEQRIHALILRHMSYTTLCFMRDPHEFEPLFGTCSASDDSTEQIDAEMWAYGFMQGMALGLPEWKPMLKDATGEALLRPIYLLGAANKRAEDQALVQTLEQRVALAELIPAALVKIYYYWHPSHHIENIPHLLTPVQRTHPKIGRNDPCFCGSGKKYKKCCGAVSLH